MFGIGRSLYFCIPQNDQLLAYWDTVADRLFKIRHCMNIEGVVRQLALFDPPIDPGALVRAVAAGLDIAGIVNNLNQPVSTIRGPAAAAEGAWSCATRSRRSAPRCSPRSRRATSSTLALLRQQHELNMPEPRAATSGSCSGRTPRPTTDGAAWRSRGMVFERYRHFKKILGTGDGEIDAAEVGRPAPRNELERGDVRRRLRRAGRRLRRRASPREAYRKETRSAG